MGSHLLLSLTTPLCVWGGGSGRAELAPFLFPLPPLPRKTPPCFPLPPSSPCLCCLQPEPVPDSAGPWAGRDVPPSPCKQQVLWQPCNSPWEQTQLWPAWGGRRTPGINRVLN